jgi:Serine carboxypeptidase S28
MMFLCVFAYHYHVPTGGVRERSLRRSGRHLRPPRGLFITFSAHHLSLFSCTTTTYQQVEYVNAAYGALAIRAHRVAFPSGSLDPWSALSVVAGTPLRTGGETAVFIDGTAHCADMHTGEPTLHTRELDAAKVSGEF